MRRADHPRLRDETNETVGLHVVDGRFFRVVIDQVESRHSIRRTYTNLGSQYQSTRSAGKAILAHLPTDVQQQILSGPLEAATDSTIVDPELLGETRGPSTKDLRSPWPSESPRFSHCRPGVRLPGKRSGLPERNRPVQPREQETSPRVRPTSESGQRPLVDAGLHRIRKPLQITTPQLTPQPSSLSNQQPG